jgi:hypothetical protein
MADASDEHIDGRSLRLELEPELFLNGGEERRRPIRI